MVTCADNNDGPEPSVNGNKQTRNERPDFLGLVLAMIAMVVLVASCGLIGGDDEAAQEVRPLLNTTTSRASTQTTIATQATTPSSEQTTSSTVDQTAAFQELADSIVLDAASLPEWAEQPSANGSPDYSAVPGCEFMSTVVDEDGHRAEARSPTFGHDQLLVAHTVRVYDDEVAVSEIMGRWQEPGVENCINEVISSELQAVFDSGVMPFDTFQVDTHLTASPDQVEYYTFVSLTSGGEEQLLTNESFLIANGNVISNLTYEYPAAANFPQYQEILDLVRIRTSDATAG